MHDFHVPISLSGLYWVLTINGDELQLPSTGRSATLSVDDAAVIDEPAFPKFSPIYSARQNFHITWEPSGDTTTLEDRTQYFLIRGYPARASADFSVVVPELGFSFKGTATSNYAFFGTEVNGYYYMQGKQPASRP